MSGKVLGHSVESLEKVLSPGRWSDGKKFEICLDGFTFVGHPVYAPEDGDWSPKPQRSGKGPKPRNGNTNMNTGGGFLDVESFQSGSDTTPLVDRNGHERTTADYDFTHMPDSFEDNTPDPRLGTSMESSSTNSGTASAEKMTMFQIVLVTSPEKASEANTLYTDIVKPLSKALHYCQKQSNYISVETKKLLAMKTKAKQKHRFTREDERTLWKSMIETSGLAWSLKEIHSKISTGEIAEFRLNGVEMALQTSLPTATSINGTEEEPPSLDPSSALLLLTSPETLLSTLASQPEATPLTHFLQSQTPTKSLAKLSLSLSIPLPSLLTLAQHLIAYRKAALLPAPLHWRNIYVVSPTAPVHELGKYSEMYKGLFPTLPSLPNMLKVLSGRPIRYGLLVPSRDHRGKYLEILEFLWREGFVVQLKTFGWLKVPRWMLEGKVPGRAREFAISFADDDSGSVSSELTAIANGGRLANRRLSELALGLGRKRGSDATAPGSVFSSEEKEEGNGMVLVVDPKEHAGLLECLQVEFEEEESREILGVILPFLDGEHAFEGLATGLGLKRSAVERVLEGLEGRGWLRSLKSI